MVRGGRDLLPLNDLNKVICSKGASIYCVIIFVIFCVGEGGRRAGDFKILEQSDKVLLGVLNSPIMAQNYFLEKDAP